jgi:16S rRNA (guanine527-N7)-methyltransferase
MFPEEHRDPTRGTVEALQAFAAMVRAWSHRVNLVSPADLEHLESRHIADSLRLLPLVQSLPPGPAADVGSGAGLPGVVLSNAAPERHWRLVEPRRRRAAFLEEVVRSLEINARVVTLGAQAAARRPELASAHMLVTARALAPPAQAFSLLQPLVAPGGVCAVFAGEGTRIPAFAESWARGIAIVRRDHSS